MLEAVLASKQDSTRSLANVDSKQGTRLAIGGRSFLGPPQDCTGSQKVVGTRPEGERNVLARIFAECPGGSFAIASRTGT